MRRTLPPTTLRGRLPDAAPASDGGTRDELYRMLARMREDHTYSRNRCFDALSSPLGHRARRIDKRLRSIERDLRAGARVDVERHPTGYRLRLHFPAVRIRREAWLTDEEHALLCRDPQLAAMLGG